MIYYPYGTLSISNGYPLHLHLAAAAKACYFAASTSSSPSIRSSTPTAAAPCTSPSSCRAC